MSPTNPQQPLMDAEWMTSLSALRAFVEHCGRTPFSFEHRPNFSTQVNCVEGALTLEDGELTICLENGAKASFVSLRHSMVPFNMPKNEDFLKAFDDARAAFCTGWMALEDSKSIMHQQYEMARAQLAEENLKIQQDAYAQTAGSNKRINKIQHQINTLESQKTHLREENNQMQDRINQMQAWINQKKKQGLPAQRAATEGENEYFPQDLHTVTHNAKMGGQAERPFTALGAQPPVGVREIQELRNKFVEKGFRPEENIRTFEGALEYLLETSPRTAAGGLSGSFSLTHEAWIRPLPGVGQLRGKDLCYPPRGHFG
ncbi:hypothetical protein DQ04_09881000 [Trypanosoma grayi]|uniref:hypothetical protein n=1 Tax=Trypanosoma grayi TaxID=71804 RepID=UPI0004F3F123|nr:hypothetical protein DQ04_09881000 [Trypanosoma grayi]KEG07410.1 hypothetical protein DQ04_09881000 [Trypanosoma grayi]